MASNLPLVRRRQLIKLGIAGVALAAVAGVGLSFRRPQVEADTGISAADADVLRAIAAAVLSASLSPDPKARAQQLDAHLAGLQLTIAAFPASTKAELSRLLAVLANPLGRFAVTGMRSDWNEARTEDVVAALQMMRRSKITLRQQSYHALRDLTNAVFYATPDNWALMGYPGPGVS
jgi:hypothetical protein